MDNQAQIRRRPVIRVFVSSTFTDLKHERDPYESHLQMIDRCYGEGSFEEASQDILTLETRWTMMSQAQRDRLLRLKAWVQARRGHLDGMEILNQIQEESATCIHSDYLYILRFAGLAPRPEFASYLQPALERFRASRPDAWPPSFREHWGAYLVWCGKAAEAEPILQDAVRASPSGLRVSSRSRATLANAKRLLGKPDEARSLVEEARRQQQEQRFNGDLADFTLPNFAKLLTDSDPQTAMTLLAEAKLIQSRTRNRLGLIRTLLLDARLACLSGMAAHGRETIQALCPAVPALATCKLFGRIMERWEVWTHAPRVLENGDTFWGL